MTITSLTTKATKLLATCEARIESGKVLTDGQQDRIEQLTWDVQDLSSELLEDGKEAQNNKLVDVLENGICDELASLSYMEQKDVDAYNATTQEPLVLKQEEPLNHCITADKTEQLETTHTNDKGISCRVIIFANHTQGGFEYWDAKTGGSSVYAEGGLWFTGKELSDYDGVYGLSSVVMETIEKLGFNADYAKD